MQGDIDDVKKAIKSALQGPGFAAALSDVVTGDGDGFWPPPVAAVYQEERLSHLLFPMAEVIGYRSTFAENDTVKATMHEIGVRWTAIGKNEAEVTKYVERLVRATTDLLWMTDLNLQVASGPIIVFEEDYSPLVPTSEHPFVKSGLVMLRVPVWRN